MDTSDPGSAGVWECQGQLASVQAKYDGKFTAKRCGSLQAKQDWIVHLLCIECSSSRSKRIASCVSCCLPTACYLHKGCAMTILRKASRSPSGTARSCDRGHPPSAGTATPNDDRPCVHEVALQMLTPKKTQKPAAEEWTLSCGHASVAELHGASSFEPRRMDQRLSELSLPDWPAAKRELVQRRRNLEQRLQRHEPRQLQRLVHAYVRVSQYELAL